MKNLILILLLVFFLLPVHAQSLKLYLAGNSSDPDLSETQPSSASYQSTVWNMTDVITFDNYYLTEDINGTDYTFSLYCASNQTRDFTAVIKIGGQQVANTSFTVSGTNYTLYSIPVTGIDPTISTSTEVVLEVTINGSGGATSGILWGNTGAPFAHILIPPAGPPVLDPPQNLTAQAINDSIVLNWDPPGGGGTVEELIYDNGAPTGAYSYNGFTMAIHMSPSGPCKILRLKYYTVTDPGNNTFNAEIYNWAGSQPGTSLIFSAPVTAVDDAWLEVDISSQNITFASDFVVGFGSINTTTYLGYDANYNNGRSFDFNGSSWSPWTETYFIRAIVEYTTGEIAELSPVTYTLVEKNSGFEVPYHKAKPRNQDKKFREVKFSGNNIPIAYSPLALIGYRVYRYGILLATVPENQTTYTDINLLPGTYCYTITGLYNEGESDSTNRACATVTYTGINTGSGDTPKNFNLFQNYPNPFNPMTNIEFQVPKPEFASLKIYNIHGQEVATLVSKQFTPGKYKYTWDATNFASGIYLYKMEAGSFTSTRKLILLR